MENAYLFVGPPGTGKTNTLKGSAELNARTYGAANVCACSYTRAAAAVIGGRGFALPEKNIGTLHSFAYRALDRPELVVKGLAEFNKLNPSFRLTAGGSKRHIYDPLAGDNHGSTVGDKLLEETEILRAKMTPRSSWPARAQNFMAAWEKWKKDADLVDFSDLLETCLRDVPSMPGDPCCILFDEAQDASRLQFALVAQWGRAAQKLVLAGDKAQTLFSWAGAEPECIDELGIPAGHTHILGQSYRLPAAVHDFAEKWLARHHPTPMTGRDYLPRAEPGAVIRKGFKWDRPEALIDLAEKEAADGKTFMILASCGYMLNPTLAVLRKRGTPFCNPYRDNEIKWNPLRQGETNRGKRINTAVDRVLAYIGFWTCDNVRLWTSVMQSKGIFKRGAKEWLEGLRGDATFPTEEFAGWCEPEFLSQLWDVSFHNPDATAAALKLWLNSMLQEKRRVLDYPCRVVMKHGKKALQEQPKIYVGSVHCSPAGEPILTKRGIVEIEKLDRADELVSFVVKSHRFQGHASHKNSKGYHFVRSERQYDGDLIEVRSANSLTRVTPNHRILARFADDFFGRWVVYLMRRGNWWRIGLCTSGHRPYRSGGVAGRLATEQADDGWILGVYKTRLEAAIAEAKFQGEFGIPGLTFMAAKNRQLNDTDLRRIHDATAGPVRERARAILKAVGSDPAWPLYRRREPKGRKNMRTTFEMEAGTLRPLSGLIRVPTFVGTHRPSWQKALLSAKPFLGIVYGLEVPPLHHYVSGNAVVHNSVKGGEADTVALFPDVSPGAWDEYCKGNRGPVVRTFYVGMTRAKETLILCQPRNSAVPW